jgi:hypothetical protein
VTTSDRAEIVEQEAAIRRSGRRVWPPGALGSG